MERDALDRARRRLAAAPDAADLRAALEQARTGLEGLAQTAAELEAGLPAQLGGAIEEGMRSEVLPVARHVAEIRGLMAQAIRRLESMGGELAAERSARLEDLALLVDLVSSGWHGVDRRLDRIERGLDRLERLLEERPGAPVYRLEAR